MDGLKLTVVGAGVAGSALAREARRRGHTVKLIGGAPSASLAALSVVRAKYVADAPDASEAVAYALERYREAGCQVIEGASVSSNQKPDPKLEPDWFAVEPAPFLVKPDVTEEKGARYVDPNSDATINCSGAAGLEGKVTFGVTWINVDPKALKLPGLNVHRYAPYRSADAVAFRSGCRLGSSSASTIEGARKEAAKIMAVATERGWIARTDGWYGMVGRRVKRDSLFGPGPAPRLWDLGGFHRSGWSLAPLRAAQLLDAIEASRA